jgi:hypothetical protein
MGRLIRTGVRFEEVLARLYTDGRFRERFLDEPRQTALEEGLSDAEAEALVDIDREGLDLACRSFAHKRDAKV